MSPRIEEPDDGVVPLGLAEAPQDRLVGATDVVVDRDGDEFLRGVDDDRVRERTSTEVRACASAGDLVEEDEDWAAGLLCARVGLREVAQPLDAAEFDRWGVSSPERESGQEDNTRRHE